VKIALLGHMGRDDALADRLLDHELHVIGQWENPGLSKKTDLTGGSYTLVDSVTDTEAIADLTQAIQPDMFITNFDDALAAGVVDTIKQRVNARKMGELLIPCPDKKASQIEWDKFMLRQIIDEIDPKYNPVNFMATDEHQVREAFEYFTKAEIDAAVKPRNLTGGKGVKVMGKHLADHEKAEAYALEVLESPSQTGVEVQEKLVGYEFTLQIFTDGNTMILPPTTFDFPYRKDGDTGPGTGGMGSFTMQDGDVMPFMTQADYDEAIELMRQVLLKLKARDIDYKGWLYPTFFKTAHGLKIVEINARGGDPELINIADLMEDDVDLADALTQVAHGELDANAVRYKKIASAVIYLVHPQYPSGRGEPLAFELDERYFSDSACSLRFSSAVRLGKNKYTTRAPSRILALSALGVTPQAARSKILEAIKAGIRSNQLEFRRDIASDKYIQAMKHSLR